MGRALQTTLASEVEIEGLGLHSGRPVRLRFRPAAADSGLVFVRTDANPSLRIQASVFYVVDTRRATALGRRGVRVCTVEHALSALYALEIDNAEIECDAEELPILDGSAAPYVSILRSAGTRELRRPRRFLTIRRPVEVRDGNRWARLLPSDELSVTYTLEYEHPLLRRQTCSFKFLPGLGPMEYEREIAPARTFGFLHEVEGLLARGLALGGSLANTVIIAERGVVNDDGLRFEDEFARHKVLDVIGDLALTGLPLRGRFEAERSGHTLHVRLIRELLDRPDSWEITEAVSPLALPLLPLRSRSVSRRIEARP
ncbi:MAG: UDP-3-O-acyl-N-acetylglucosamine deacetylase [Vicinamibacteria bacterium]